MDRGICRNALERIVRNCGTHGAVLEAFLSYHLHISAGTRPSLNQHSEVVAVAAVRLG